MTDPRRTIELLEELKQLGFTDRAFARLHHFRLQGRDDNIADHAAYCEKQGSLRAGGTNEAVQLRLQLVLNAYRSGGFKSGLEAVFVSLAEAAWAEIPGNENGDS
ncbi:MAG: hypothetical protein K0S79_183 [Nitrospira sp.]|jgi:hypothetical protein|nr:hypothetical protein [Nitrospira sp.]